MTGHELKVILTKIKRLENLTLQEISDKADVTRTYLNRMFNKKNETLEPGGVLFRLNQAFPEHFAHVPAKEVLGWQKDNGITVPPQPKNRKEKEPQGIHEVLQQISKDIQALAAAVERIAEKIGK